MLKPLHVLIISSFLSLAAGYLLNEVTPSLSATSTSAEDAAPQFHDIRINPVESFPALIEPTDPEVVKLAKQFSSFEEAYNFVHNEISFAPFVPSGPVGGTLKHRTGSCLGKATLLASLYRAMGMAAEDVRIIMGIVVTDQGMADHVWLDLEVNGQCLQQDPSGMIGRFAFAEFPGKRYSKTYAMKETFCFNESDFAVISQLNGMRD
jgi:transglutaminase-like putative cysteine protease